MKDQPYNLLNLFFLQFPLRLIFLPLLPHLLFLLLLLLANLRLCYKANRKRRHARPS